MILINIPGTEQIKKSSGVFRNEWNPCAIDPEEHLEQKSAGFIPGRESVSRLVAIGRVCVTTSRLCPRSTRVSDKCVTWAQLCFSSTTGQMWSMVHRC